MIKVIDGHCDVLSKLLQNPRLDFAHDPTLDVTLTRLKQGNVALQCFAVYLSEHLASPLYDAVLESIDLFHRKILSHKAVGWIRTKQDLLRALNEGKIGAMLTLEGADAIQGRLMYLRTLFRLGVRMISMTWNYGNWAADGVLEPRGGGLTYKGKSFVKECNRLGILLDISHLCEASFWDVAELCDRPLVATHSNAYRICSHPRNLKDEQIQHLIQRGGIMGLTFVPQFVANHDQVSMLDLLRHIDYVCTLGGENQIAFGSDFDGIDRWIPGLEHPGQYQAFGELLSKYYNEKLVHQFLYQNWSVYLQKHLPNEGQ